LVAAAAAAAVPAGEGEYGGGAAAWEPSDGGGGGAFLKLPLADSEDADEVARPKLLAVDGARPIVLP